MTTNSTLITDYLGQGTAAARPASVNIASSALGFYYADDTQTLSLWNGTAYVTVSVGQAGSVAGTGIVINAGTVALANINAGQVLANTGTAAAAPQGVSLSAVIDTIGSTQGDLLYRGASAWNVLAPGNAGQVLKSQGASANPQWSSDPYVVGGFISGTLTASQIVLAHTFAQKVVVPANFGTAVSGAKSDVTALINATGSTTLTVAQCPAASDPTVSGNWSTVGSVVIAAAGHTATLSTTGGTSVTFQQGDRVRVTGPATPDATLANLMLTLAGDR